MGTVGVFLAGMAKLGWMKTATTKKKEAALREAFARHLQAAMKFRGVETQKALAHASGIGASDMTRLLQGTRMPNLHTLAMLAVALKMPPGDLIPPDALTILLRAD